MESWSYVSEEKGYLNLSNDAISQTNNTKASFFGWELKTPCDFSNEVHQGFDDFGAFDDPIGGAAAVQSRKMEATSPSTAPDAFSVAREDFNSKLSNSFGGSGGCRDPLIDLKLGRLADHGDAAAGSRGQAFSRSSESCTPPKRVRASSGVQTQQAAYCQVYRCNKDLSGCKDYHKRHKVCEAHSKTSKVIVNGVEQRFCQQCSRFHLLAEFDDGKRSCRKRLAGHNERRRKPQVGIHSGKPGRLLQPYGDSRFQGTVLTSASFICQEIHPSRVLSSERYGTNGWWRPIKSEDGGGFRHLSSIPITNGQHPQSRSLFPSYNEKQFPYLHENVATPAAGSIFCESNSQYHPHALEGPNSGSQSLFQDTSLASEDFNVFDTESTIQGLSGMSDSGCALSLLSSQSNSSSQSSGIPMARPVVIPNNSHSHYGMSPVSEKMMGISSQASSGVSDRFASSELNPADGSHLSPVLISDNNEIVNFEIADGIFQGSDFVNVKDHRLSGEDVPTIDLLQLSSQLQRVEHQRQSLQVKQENESSCSLRIT